VLALVSLYWKVTVAAAPPALMFAKLTVAALVVTPDALAAPTVGATAPAAVVALADVP
jgi:hypothetical protein